MTSQSKNYLIVVVGPTAIGKTDLSIRLAKHFNTEIISADSRQFYKEMGIGTAKPTSEELESAPHHLVDFISIKDKYSAGSFERDALSIIQEIHSKNQTAVMVGGSGMYVDAVCKGLDNLPHSPEIREKLNTQLKEQGIEALQQELQKLDPEHYNLMDIQNPQRLIRALEVCLASGKAYSNLRKNENADRPFEIIKIGLTADREIIYQRINQRVDKMMEAGLLEEVKSLLEHQNLNALNTVGYKELIAFFNGEFASLDEAIEKIKMNTRRFAKRQLTWYNKDPEIIWFDYGNSSKIIEYVQGQILNPSK